MTERAKWGAQPTTAVDPAGNVPFTGRLTTAATIQILLTTTTTAAAAAAAAKPTRSGTTH